MPSLLLSEQLEQRKNRKTCGLLLLIDPDKCSLANLKKMAHSAADGFLIGGSLLTNGSNGTIIHELKKLTEKPVFLFPGHSIQIVPGADGILLPSLISGRNADYLIGQHVHASFAIQQLGLQVIPTGYLLIGEGMASTTQYITQTLPIPSDKPEIVLATAWAGLQLGMQAIYLEGGSGSGRPISPELVQTVSDQIKAPLIVGGGITQINESENLKNSGANMLVIGNALEKNINFIDELNELFRS